MSELINYPSEIVQIPGPIGAGGALPIQVTAAFNVPAAAGGEVTVSVLTAAGFCDGQNVYVGGANFTVKPGTIDLTLNRVTLIFQNFYNDAASSTIMPGAIINAGTGGLTLPLRVDNGGTGLASLPTFVTDMFAATDASAALAMLLGGLPLPVASGGTAATTAAGALAALGIQCGTSIAMVGGTVTVTGVTITASSVIVVTRKHFGSAAGFIKVLDSDRTVGADGTGSFIIKSTVVAGTDNLSGETSTFDYLIIG